MAFTRRIEKQRTMERGWRKCLMAQFISFGGSSQGVTLMKRTNTPIRLNHQVSFMIDFKTLSPMAKSNTDL